MHFVAHDLQRPKQIAGASQTQEKHRGAAVSRHAFSINSHNVLQDVPAAVWGAMLVSLLLFKCI